MSSLKKGKLYFLKIPIDPPVKEVRTGGLFCVIIIIIVVAVLCVVTILSYEVDKRAIDIHEHFLLNQQQRMFLHQHARLIRRRICSFLVCLCVYLFSSFFLSFFLLSSCTDALKWPFRQTYHYWPKLTEKDFALFL